MDSFYPPLPPRCRHCEQPAARHVAVASEGPGQCLFDATTYVPMSDAEVLAWSRRTIDDIMAAQTASFVRRGTQAAHLVRSISRPKKVS